VGAGVACSRARTPRPGKAELETLLVTRAGNLAASARAMDRALIRRWLQRYGLDPAKFR